MTDQTSPTGRIAIPLTSAVAMETPYTVPHRFSYQRTQVINAGTTYERSYTNTESHDLTLLLNKMQCSSADVDLTKAFLRDLFAQDLKYGTLDVTFTKPVFRIPESKLMGVSEHGKNPVHFPETEKMTLFVVAPAAQWDATLALLAVACLKNPEPEVLRDFCASAYMAAWKSRPGNRPKTAPAFMSQTGFLDRHVKCLVSFDSRLGEALAKVAFIPKKEPATETEHA